MYSIFQKITFAYNNLHVALGPNFYAAEKVKQCNVYLRLTGVPDNTQLAVVSSTYRGHTRLDKGITKDMYSTFKYFGNADDVIMNNHAALAGDGGIWEAGKEYNETVAISSKSQAFSPCGGNYHGNFQVLEYVRLVLERGNTTVVSGEDSRDVPYVHEIGLRRRQSSLPDSKSTSIKRATWPSGLRRHVKEFTLNNYLGFKIPWSERAAFVQTTSGSNKKAQLITRSIPRAAVLHDLEKTTPSPGLEGRSFNGCQAGCTKMQSLESNGHWQWNGAERASTGDAAPLTTGAGQTAVIPSWDLQSSAKTGSDLKALSKPGVDTSSWHRIKNSKCTLMGCLIETGVYNESDLFHSTNLQRVNEKQFLVPWNYRNEFTLEPGSEKHFFLQTHGISSRADIFLNGQQVASKSEQAGSYAGKSYEITKLVDKSNALAIQVHPTSYYYDFALGWVDWNPWPTDNGTGIWRDVEIKQTGPVALSPLRIVTKIGDTYDKLGQPAKVSLKAKAQNLENTPITITATGTVALVTDARYIPLVWNKAITIPPLSTTDIELENTVENPAIWWPKQWGDQPLYSASLTISTSSDNKISDFQSANFGFRSVTSKLNSHSDVQYSVNGLPFQVIGAGYTPNMFLRFDAAKWETELKYVLDLGFNTVRLEGKNEHPELYDIADRLGVFLMPGWECCDKWEAWSYNQDLAVPTPVWSADDYRVANESMLHEAAMLQTHPSVLTYLIGSDYWTDDRATPIYLNALKALDWQTPIIGSASKRGYSALTGPSGMKMEGPYDWVPPNYWYDVEPYGSRYGAAFGFGSELGAGVGTPELSSLKKFLNQGELDDLWKSPNKALYHMSRVGSEFTTRKTYNNALWKRLGAPTSLDDYLTKAQIMDYEATRAQFEAFGVNWNAKRPATGLIYWMLNNAWPSLHWNIWDYYMKPAGSYFGAKVGSKKEHVVYDPLGKAVWLVDRSGPGSRGAGDRRVEVEVVDLSGKVVFSQQYQVARYPGTSNRVAGLSGQGALGGIRDVVFLRLVLKDGTKVIDRNVYWVSKDLDVLDWGKSEWYVTPVTRYADYTGLNKLAAADVSVTAAKGGRDAEVLVTLENKAKVVAFFISLNLVDRDGNDVLPITWDDNYVTLWPGEKLTLTARSVSKGKWNPSAVQVGGKNVGKKTVSLG
ncbi:hypothetical protein QBC44DRAFT_359738 [Cladorrhinum sp. PSN332]|nr:hypothetical protein QBC44DRAFT_359738 [Cladorrhinum sp. PSN332]